MLLMPKVARILGVACACWLVLAGVSARGGSHLWVINEVFSDADGTIQFVEMYNCCEPMEIYLVPDKYVHSHTTLKQFFFDANLAEDTTDRYILLATAGFAALPGAPTPDHIMEDNFFDLTADTVEWWMYPLSVLVFGAGQLPTDGLLSLNRDGSTGVNSPTNFQSESGSVNVSGSPPTVPDGTVGLPMIVGLPEPGGALPIFWDSATCGGPADHALLYGQGSQLPAVPGGTFGLSGSECSLGASPFLWTAVPEAGDGSGLVWWLIVAQEGAGEGSWGRPDGILQRVGPGPGGSSGQCGMTGKDTNNICGQ